MKLTKEECKKIKITLEELQKEAIAVPGVAKLCGCSGTYIHDQMKKGELWFFGVGGKRLTLRRFIADILEPKDPRNPRRGKR